MIRDVRHPPFAERQALAFGLFEMTRDGGFVPNVGTANESMRGPITKEWVSRIHVERLLERPARIGRRPAVFIDPRDRRSGQPKLPIERVQVGLDVGVVVGVDDRNRLTRAVADDIPIERNLIHAVGALDLLGSQPGGSSGCSQGSKLDAGHGRQGRGCLPRSRRRRKDRDREQLAGIQRFLRRYQSSRSPLRANRKSAMMPHGCESKVDHVAILSCCRSQKEGLWTWSIANFRPR
jgi:hypothetical protein